MSGDKVRQLLDVIGRQNVAIEKLIAERDELRQHLENLAPDAPDAHACLRRIYNDPRAKDAERGKAAAAAIGYEKSKPASVVVLGDFRERVRNARLRQLELDRAEWARQDAAKLDLDAPTPPTILGEGMGVHGAYRDHEDDPAA
jgi:hypothetical protein